MPLLSVSNPPKTELISGMPRTQPNLQMWHSFFDYDDNLFKYGEGFKCSVSFKISEECRRHLVGGSAEAYDRRGSDPWGS